MRSKVAAGDETAAAGAGAEVYCAVGVAVVAVTGAGGREGREGAAPMGLATGGLELLWFVLGADGGTGVGDVSGAGEGLVVGCVVLVGSKEDGEDMSESRCDLGVSGA